MVSKKSPTGRNKKRNQPQKPPTDKLFEDLIFELHRVTRAWPDEFPAIEEFLTKRLNAKNKQ